MDGDVTDAVPAVRVPMLVCSRPQSAGPAQYVAARIPGAAWREIPGHVVGYSWANPAGSPSTSPRESPRSPGPERSSSRVPFATS